MSNGQSTKCPACGYQLTAMATVCDACGTEIKSNRASSIIESIVTRFNEIENEVSALGYSGKELHTELTLRKSRFIRDLPVPNSREELLGLVHYIRPRIEDAVKPDPNAEDWRAKFREVMSLAKSAFKNDSKTRNEFEEIEKSVQITLSGSLKTKAKRSPVIFIAIVVALAAAILGVINIELDKRKASQCEENFDSQANLEKVRLEKIQNSATQELKEGKFTEAFATASTLSWTYQANCRQDAASQMKADWDTKKISLQDLISKEKNKLEADKKAAFDKAEAEKREIERKQEAAKAAAESKAATVKRKAATDKEF